MFTSHQHIIISHRGRQTFPEEGHVLNISGLAAHVVTVAMTQCCLSSAKAATGNTERNESGCVPIKLDLRVLKLEVHEILLCQEYCSFLSFPDHFKRLKS